MPGLDGGHGPKGNGVSTYLTHSMGARSFSETGCSTWNGGIDD